MEVNPEVKKVEWYRQKTFWSGLGVIVTGVLALFTDVMTQEQSAAVMTIFGGLTAIFLRQGVEKKK
jgi:predicted ribosomally synthesized peptide with SipW-like signal peptide